MARPTGFLAGLDAETQQRVLGSGRERRYPPRSLLFFAGDDAHEVLIVRRGAVKVSVTVDGREVVLDVLGEHDILGELSAIDGGTRSATATALTEVEVVVIPFEVFSKLIDDAPAIGVALVRAVTVRLRDASRRQVEYGALDAVGRVCRRLVEMIDRYGCRDRDTIVITNPLSQQDIAGWAGLSREAVVKALQALRALRWIDTAPGSIKVLDPDAVRARASLRIGVDE